MGRIGACSTYRAEFGALLLGKAAYALGATLRVDYIYRIAFFNSLVGARGFTCTTADAIVANLECHV
jgi:hypothetical protein